MAARRRSGGRSQPRPPRRRGRLSTPPSPSGTELAALGLFLCVVIVVPLLVGLGVDGALHSGPAGLVVGLLVGIVAGVAGIYVRFRRYL